MKFCLPLAAIVIILAVAALLFGNGLGKPRAGELWQHLETGNTEKAFWLLTDLFRENGIDVQTEGQWKLDLEVQDFKELINQYKNGQVKIRVSRMMKPEETEAYWDNWSKVLAAGNFDQKAFFKDDRERHLLANYNVLILSAHELGHYVDALYNMSDRDFGGGALHDNDPLNCTEGYADRFAVATANHLSSDTRFAALRSRYLELIKTFNNSIPSQNRYNFDSMELAGSRCGEADLMKNGLNDDGSVSENYFRQYASAYFERHRLMLEDKGFGDLAKVAERDLIAPYLKRMEYVDAKFNLTTIRQFGGTLARDISLGGDRLREMIEFNLGLDDLVREPDKPQENKHKLRQHFINFKGEPRVLEIDWLSEGKLSQGQETILKAEAFSLTIKTVEEKKLETMRVSMPANLKGSFNVSSFAALTDEEFVLVLTPFDLKAKVGHIAIVHGTKVKKRWTTDVLKFTLPGLTDADEIGAGWFATPNRKLRFLRREKADEKGNSRFTLYEVDRKDFSATAVRPPFVVNVAENSLTRSKKNGLWRSFGWDEGAFGNDAGDIFVAGGESNLQTYEDGNLFVVTDKPRLVVGGLSGIRDGNDVRKARISFIVAPTFIAQDRIVFIDTFGGKHYVREIRFPASNGVLR